MSTVAGVKMRLKVGDLVHAWGIGFPKEYLIPGPVTRIYQDRGSWLVDWHNELARHFAVSVERLVLADTPMSFGLERALSVGGKQ